MNSGVNTKRTVTDLPVSSVSNTTLNMIEDTAAQQQKIATTKMQLPASPSFLPSSQQTNCPTEINKKIDCARMTNPKVNGDGVLATDTIIEELKSLAKSMLDATVAARSRANTLENRRSYEALMSAIESRTKPAAGNEMKESGSITGLARNTVKERRTSTDTDSRASGLFFSMMGLQKLSTTAVARGDTNAPQSTQKENQTVHHKDPMTGIDKNTWGVESEHITDIPASLSKQDLNKKYANTEGQQIVEDTKKINSVSTLPVAKQDNRSELHLPMSKANILIANDISDTDEADENIYNGVKTQAFFKSTDPDTYWDIVSSAWKPECLLRSEDGTTIPYKKSGSNKNGNYHTHQDAENESNSSKASDAYEGSSPTCNENNKYLEDCENRAVSSTEKSAHLSQKPQRVYRVPAFPYGGGITDEQANEMSQMFKKCISHGCGHYYRSGGSKKRTGNIIPKFISKKDFNAHNYDEVPCYAEMKPFKPVSPFEFVVEVEHGVLFDVLHAREERRRAFRRLAKQGLAPVTMGTFNLRVIMDPTKTGFEDEKNFPIVRGTVIADRYKIVQLLGKATFSRAVCCYDLNQPIYEDDASHAGEAADPENDVREAIVDQNACIDGDAAHSTNGHIPTSMTDSMSKKEDNRRVVGFAEVCLKIINNTKDFFDQSLDEIRLLTLLNSQKDPDEAHIVRLIDAFYYKEHTMLVTELLSDNLYEHNKYNREEEEELYFTLPRIRRIARQVVEALAYVHSLNLIHADLKPENILFVSHRQCIVKVIDFGSSCFLSDHLSSYIQSRSYRAPEVIFGCDYDGRIDVWSLGAILFELVTGEVLFASETAPEMLARIVYVCGMPFPRQMLWEGRHTCDFINKFGCIYEVGSSKAHNNPDISDIEGGDSREEEPYYVYTPVIAIPNRTKTSKKVTDPRTNKEGEMTSGIDSNVNESSNSRVDPVSTDIISDCKGGGNPSSEFVNGPYSVLRQKLAGFGMTDESFLSFVEACLTLDHKKRPTSVELLSHEFIANEKV